MQAEQHFPNTLAKPILKKCEITDGKDAGVEEDEKNKISGIRILREELEVIGHRAERHNAHDEIPQGKKDERVQNDKINKERQPPPEKISGSLE